MRVSIFLCPMAVLSGAMSHNGVVRNSNFELLRVSPCQVTSRCVTIILPGNPGLVEYYRDFATELARLTVR